MATKNAGFDLFEKASQGSEAPTSTPSGGKDAGFNLFQKASTTEAPKEVKPELPRDSSIPQFKDDAEITMVNPEGKLVKILGKEVPNAVHYNYQFATPEQDKNYQFLKENEGIGGGIWSGLYGAVDEATFGVGSALHKGLDPEGAARAEALMNEYKAEAYTGRGLGFLGTMLYGGEVLQPVAKAGMLAERGVAKVLTSVAEKEIATKLVGEGMSHAAAAAIARPTYKAIATSAAKLGVEGATMSAPKAITEAVLGDPLEAAETLAYGFGGGALLGGIGAVGSKLGQLSKEALKLGDGALIDTVRGGLEGLSYKLQAKNAGALKSNVSKLGAERVEASSRLLTEEGFLNQGVKSLGQVTDDVERAAQSGWQKMDEAMNALDSNVDKLRVMEPMEGRTSLLDDLNKMRDEMKFSSGANAYKADLLDESIDSLSKDLRSIADSATPTRDLQELRRAMDQKLKFNAQGVPAQEAFKQEIRGVFNTKLNQLVEDAAIKLEMPEIAAQWKQGNKLYSAASDYRSFLQNRENADIGNNLFGLNDNIAGTAGIVGAISHLNPAPLALPLAKKAIETSYGQTAIASALYRLSKAGGDKAGIALAAETMAHAQSQIDEIPKVLKRLGTQQKLSLGTNRALGEFLGKTTSKPTLEERKKYAEELSQKIKVMSMDPETTAKQLAELANPLTLGAPKVSEAYVQQKMKTYEYILSILPKNSTDNSLNPFQKPKYNISDQQLTTLEKTIEVINNPFVVIKSLENGTLSKPQMEALKNIYPIIYEQMRGKIMESAYDGNENMPYDARLKLSLLMGEPLDNSIGQTKSYQQTFASPEQNAPAKSKLNLITPKSNPYATQTQKAQ